MTLYTYATRITRPHVRVQLTKLKSTTQETGLQNQATEPPAKTEGMDLFKPLTNNKLHLYIAAALCVQIEITYPPLSGFSKVSLRLANREPIIL